MEDFKKFLREECIPLLQQLEPGQKGVWGKMDAQQMVEHLVLITRVANGKFKTERIEQTPHHAQKLREFLLSDQPFVPGFRAPGIGEEPEPYHYENIGAAINKLQPEFERLIEVYENDPTLTILHPVFGDLDYTLQMRYMQKHVHHHLKQFGLVD